MHLHAVLMLPIFALTMIASPIRAGSVPDTGRFIFRSVRVAGESHRYAVWLPPGHAARHDWPAVMFLHGSGECGRDGEKPTRVGFGPALALHPERWACLVPICGYGRARNIQRRAMRLPAWAFHGLRDDVVDPNDTRRIVEGIRHERAASGLDPGAVHMTLFPEANHNSWDPAFAHDSLNVWLRERLGAR